MVVLVVLAVVAVVIGAVCMNERQFGVRYKGFFFNTHTYDGLLLVGKEEHGETKKGDVDNIFKSQVLSSVIRMRPIKDIREMSVVWQLPSTEHYNSPNDLISYILGEDLFFQYIFGCILSK